jgi:hypothetical protein
VNDVSQWRGASSRRLTHLYNDAYVEASLRGEHVPTPAPGDSVLHAALLDFRGEYRQVRSTQGWLDDVELRCSAADAVRLACWIEARARQTGSHSRFLFSANAGSSIRVVEFDASREENWADDEASASIDPLRGQLLVFLNVLSPKPREDALFLSGSAESLNRLASALSGAARSARIEQCDQWLLPKRGGACPDTTQNSCMFAIVVSA